MTTMQQFKCGEVFFIKPAEYIFVCWYCKHNFDSFISFRNHSENYHNEVKDMLVSNDQLKKKICRKEEIKEACNKAQINNEDENYENTSDHTIQNVWINETFVAQKSCQYFDTNKANLIKIEPNLQDNNETESSNLSSESEFDDDSYEKDTIYCIYCKYGFKAIENHNQQKCATIQKIINNHNSNYKSLQREGIYLCTECPRYFEALDQLGFHQRSHINQNDRRIQCSYCDKKFKMLVHLRRHELNHQNDSLKCSYCGKSFKRPMLLKNHIRTHTGEKPFQCSKCPAGFALKCNLNVHVIYKHTDDKPFQCRHESGCKSSFKTDHLRNIHEKRHSLNTEFQCEICGMNFNVQAKLRMHHKKKHMDYSERPHKCAFCDKKFLVRGNLHEHERSHTGEKPLKCNQCSRSFARKNSLREHQKLHSGEKQHICKICGKAFAQLAGYWSHMKNHS